MPEALDSIKLVVIPREIVQKAILNTMRLYGDEFLEDEWGELEESDVKRVSYNPTRRVYDVDICTGYDFTNDVDTRSISRLALLDAVEDFDFIEIDGEIPESSGVVGAGFDRDRDVAYIEIESDDFESVMEAEEAPRIDVEVAEEGENDG